MTNLPPEAFQMTDFRRIARELVHYACGGSAPLDAPAQGRPSLGDPVYRAVTESRQERAARAKPPQFYSSCGDLGHWLLFRLGLRFDWVNRDENVPHGWTYTGQPGKPKWRNNVSTLAAGGKGGMNPWARVPSPGDHFLCGDILIVNTHDPATTHVRVVLEHVPELERLVTGDYGQPGGAIRESRIVVAGSRLKAGSRWVDSVLPMFDVIDAARVAGALEDYETADEWARRLKLPRPGVLTVGARGEAVAAVQRIVGATPDGAFGPLTKAAVERWQRAHGLSVTGEWGPLEQARHEHQTDPAGMPALCPESKP